MITISQLEMYVTGLSGIKGKVVKLLIEAMNDWPTSNLTSVDLFINEIEQYFGTPVTRNLLAQRNLDTAAANAWKSEAASSLIAIFDLPGNESLTLKQIVEFAISDLRSSS